VDGTDTEHIVEFNRHAGLVPASNVQQWTDSVVEAWTPEQVRGDEGSSGQRMVRIAVRDSYTIALPMSGKRVLAIGAAIL